MKIFNLLYLTTISLFLIACNTGKDKRGLIQPILQKKNISSKEKIEASFFLDKDDIIYQKDISKQHHEQPYSQDLAYKQIGNHFNYLPKDAQNAPSIILRREGYTTSYNPITKQPNWVAWQLTPKRISGSVTRKGIEFQPDYEVDNPVDTYDYFLSGFDRGHMCPAADNKWSKTAMKQSFLMTNICPQLHSLNSGLWNSLEVQCRNWTRKYGLIYIISGPIFTRKQHRTIGKHKVMVPEAFFKVVLCMEETPRAIGWVVKNIAEKGRKKTDFVNSIDQVERITGIDFFPALPDNIENKVEAEADFRLF